MTEPYSDRNLLIGILAVQLDFVGRDQLVAAMMDWVSDKSRSMDQVLFEKRLIDFGKTLPIRMGSTHDSCGNSMIRSATKKDDTLKRTSPIAFPNPQTIPEAKRVKRNRASTVAVAGLA